MATPMHHFNMQNDDHAQQLIALLKKRGITEAVVTSVGDYAGNWQRIAVSNDGQLMTMKKGSSRKGYPLSRIGQISVPAELLLPVKPDTAGKKAAMTLIKYRAAFDAHCLPWLWESIRQELHSMDDTWLAELALLDNTNENLFVVSDKMRERGVSWVEEYRTTTLAGNECPEGIQHAIAAAFEERRKGRWEWRGKYDYSVSLEPGIEDGATIWRAVFRQEYKNCDNGHYWYLLSPTRAIFAEDD